MRLQLHLLTCCLLTAGIVSATGGSMHAQTTIASGYALTESLAVIDPALSGQGGAGLASTSSYAWASFRNPAILPFVEGKGSSSASWQRHSPSESVSDCFSGAFSIRLGDRGGLSAGISRRTWDSVEEFSASGKSYGTFEPKYVQANIGYGFAVTERLSVGATARFMRQSLHSDGSTTAFAGDLFAMLRTSLLDLTAGLSNMGADVENSQGDKFPIPSSMAVGVSKSMVYGTARLTGNADARLFMDGGAAFMAGVECLLTERYVVRAGGSYASDDAPVTSSLTLGAGFRMAGFALDAAYVLAPSSIAGTLCFGVAYWF